MSEREVKYLPCATCGGQARVSPFSARWHDYASHETDRECIVELAARVAQLERRSERSENVKGE